MIGIRDGVVSCAFRRWRRPTVRSGGTLKTAVGELEIVAVDIVGLRAITTAEAKRAGYASRKELHDELAQREGGDIYRIEFGALRADPRTALRGKAATGAELAELLQKLQRMDQRATAGAWTVQVLELLSRNPGVRAGDLCRQLRQEKDVFKRNVRKLKNLGLTESLGTGYRISPRGKAVLQAARKDQS
ncbi:MAG: hypothetical protein AAF581_09645 [Planctomycetota bacterium]